MDIYEIKVLLALHVGNEELVLKNASGKKLADSNDYFVVTDDGICHLFDANGREKDVSAVTTLTENMVSKDIKKIVIPNSVTGVGNSTFEDCNKLTSITIGNSVTNIGSYAFYCCSSLTSIMIPDSAMIIGDYAFSNCTSLTSMTILDNVMSIGEGAFENCSSLMNATIPNSVTSIQWWAFSGCSGLASVTIPDGVTSIGRYIFLDCSNLKSLVFKGKTLEEVKAMDNYPFGIQDESVIKCIDKMHTAA